MRVSKIVVSTILFLSISAFSAQSVSANNGNQFGKNNPFGINDLPPGQLKNRLDKLPAPARDKALSWMHQFDFTDKDLPMLRIDDNGGVFYEDPTAANSEISSSAVTTPAPQELSLGETFALHSKPGASRTVFLDMDGRVVSGTAWNNGVDPLFMRPYDSDGIEGSFSQNELNAIAETWKRIAEDYAPFDIDVTTEDPGNFGPNVAVILVTPKADENGNEIYSCSCGGVAYVGVWGLSNYASTYQPALVFTDGVGTGPHNISEAASHELGHNLGLSHDGNNSTGYYQGHGTGNVEWAPIMGVGYYAEVTQWSKGEYANANQLQDDLQIISGHLNDRADDHENVDPNNATPLAIVGTSVTSTNSVTDPFNAATANKGIIENRADVDLFSFTAGAGAVDLSVTPDWIDTHVAQSNRGMNLDIKATLFDEFGSELTSDNLSSETDAQITFNVVGGTYVLAIEGVGLGDVLGTGYSDYGSLGNYYINGTLPELGGGPYPPVADFSVDCTGQVCTFDSVLSSDLDGTIVEKFWQIDNPSMSSAIGDVYSVNFENPGTYNVSLTVTDNDGLTDSITKAVTVEESSFPLADFSYNCVDLDCTFDASTSTDEGGAIVSYDWTFGDDSTGSGEIVSHSYSAAGTYRVVLNLVDNEGLTAAAATNVTVTQAPQPPAAPSNLTADVVTQGKGKKVTVVSVDLSWTDNGDNETSFVIERCVETGKGKNKQCNFASYATPNADVTTYSDPNPAAKAQYRVKAVNGAGESAYSNIVKL